MPKSKSGVAPVARGHNPAPIDGWPWHLNAYEIAYVLEYNVRPVREGDWAEDATAETRLDLEADGVRNQSSSRRKRRSTLKRWPFVLAFAVLVSAAGIMAFEGVINVNHASQLDEKTHAIESKK